jgi:hypothetical protein
MIESKSKRRAKSISSRRKNVRDETITIHCLWHSKATEKEWFFILCLRWCLSTSFFFWSSRDSAFSSHHSVLNLKFVVVSRTFFFASRRDRFEIFDVSRDLWLRVLAQRARHQSLDDESHMMRNVFLNSIFFSLIMIRFFYIWCAQIIMSNFLDVQRKSFSTSTSRRRYSFCAFLISEELDLEKESCSRDRRFYRV